MIAAALRPWQPSHGVLGGHGVRGGQVLPGGLQVPLRAVPVVVCRIERGDDLFCELPHVAERVEGLVFGVTDRLEELSIGAVPAAGVPVGAAAGLITGRGAARRIQCGDGGPQADDGARVEARTGRAVQDRGDGRG